MIVELYRQWIGTGSSTTDPSSVTAVHHASRIALGEHLEEKLEMLKAVLLNSATSDRGRLDDVPTLRYMRSIDELEPEPG